VGGLGWFGWRTLKRWYARHDPEVRGIVLGGLASMFAVGIHSLVDFNLHIPANALLLAVILGMTSVAVHLRQRHGRSIAVFRTRTLSLPRPLRWSLYPLAMLATLALGLPVVSSYAADRQAQLAMRAERGARDIAELEATVELWTRAVALDPGNADYHYRLAHVYERAMRAQWDSDPPGALASGIQAMAAYREAILRNPTTSFPFLHWGWMIEGMSGLAAWVAGQESFVTNPFRLGEHDLKPLITRLAQRPEGAAEWSRRLLRTATHLDPTTAFIHYSAGMYALPRWEALGSEERARVIQELRSASQLDQKFTAAILQALWERTRDADLVRAMARGTSEEGRWLLP